MKKFFKCQHCGNIIEMVHESGVPVVCCGEPMKELVPNTTEAAFEKHIPVIEVLDKEVTVKVGEVAHPMMPEHHIEVIILETTLGVQKKYLAADGEPVAKFALVDGEKVVAAYEYCNLHGFWKKEL